MPVISRFYGIAIMMYFQDHNPPHFHAKYGEYEAVYSFAGKVLDGSMPGRAEKLIQEWLEFHKPELEDNWNRAQSGEHLLSIAPLE